MGSKPTIQDIARLAGVSKATVSRVLNQKSNVDPVTRERVLRVMKEQGYVPSITATGLAGGRSRLIGVLTPPITWPGVPEIMSGVAATLARSSYEMVLYGFTPEHDPSDVLDRILAMKLTSGLLAILPGGLTEHLIEFYREGLPMVTIDDQEEPNIMPWVGIDNCRGGYLATRHLLNLGYRRIAHIHGPQNYRCARERYQGSCQALCEAGITPDPRLLFQGSFELASGFACAETIFSMPPAERPDAIFVGNDQMAYGLLSTAEQYGVRIPEDIAVVGFDDIPISAHMNPPLTTVRQPFIEMGRRAIELLLSLIDPLTAEEQVGNGARPLPALNRLPAKEGEEDEPIRIELDTRLIVRESCGASRRSLRR